MNDNQPRERQDNKGQPQTGRFEDRQAQDGRPQAGDRNDKKTQSGSRGINQQRGKSGGRDKPAAE